MSYQVLARKWRPKSFADMVGQEHVLKALVNAMAQGRLHHAYLFTGTRGVGKTTIARIIAKCLNCEQGVSDQPCGQCTNCQEIDQGRFIDLIEVDAASRTRVEDTRELLDNVQYAPTRGRYKVYLIDEVHMLSGHSFNALLKTLEEPPPHVKFLLATTDPQKLPITVLSRCLQFNLKALTPELIRNRLRYILQQEQIHTDDEALALIAQAANGSMRDALSLMDQAIAFGDNQVKTDEVRQMLGSIEHSHIFALLQALRAKDAKQIIQVCANLTEMATDFQNALEELLSLLHQIALQQMVPDLAHDYFSEQYAKQIAELATVFEKETVQLYYQIGLLGRRDLPLAPTPRIGFEMTLLRMLAFQPASPVSEKDIVTAKPTPATRQSQTQVQTQQQTNNTTTKTKSPTTKANKATAEKVDAPKTQTISIDDFTRASQPWRELLQQLDVTGMTKSLCEHCALSHLDDNKIKLLLDASQAPLLNDNIIQRLQDALNKHLGKEIKLTITIAEQDELATPARLAQAKKQRQLQQAELALNNDENLQSLLQTFNANVQSNSINPTATQTEES